MSSSPASAASAASTDACATASASEPLEPAIVQRAAEWMARLWDSNPIIDQLEKEQIRTDIPEFNPGDTVRVEVKVVEGDKSRLQAFEGNVIAKRNRGLNSSFTVRKISSGEGVERVFQTNSPLIASVKVTRRGDVRRAKLYYLRDRAGKSARIREKIN